MSIAYPQSNQARPTIGGPISGMVSRPSLVEEPVLFLQGFESNDISNASTAMLRGSLIVKVTKSAKLKAITLHFKGKARTEWPEGTLCLLSDHQSTR